MQRKELTSVLLVFAIACQSVGPDYEAPEPELPETFDEVEAGAGEEAAELGAWWNDLEDPLLGELVDEALVGSLDLRTALFRVEAARALVVTQVSARFPNVDAIGDAARIQNSAAGGIPVQRVLDIYTLGIEAGWEIDLWGRVRRSVEAAEADLGVSVELARDVLVSVAAATAQTYVDVRGFQARLAIAEENVRIQTQTADLVRRRNELGLVSRLDLVRALANLAETRSQIPLLEQGLEAARNRLAVLVGVLPGSLDVRLEARAALPVGASSFEVGVPAELLRRRPDVRAAERSLAAETARVGVSEAELYPQFRLTGAIGYEGPEPTDMFDASSVFFAFGPSFRWSLFDRGRLRALVDSQRAVLEQARLAYEASILRAVEEVENALRGLREERRRREDLLEATELGREAVELSREQYRQGLVDFQGVLDAERTLFLVEDNLTQSEVAIVSYQIELYRALGGGWDLSEEVQAESSEEGSAP